MRLRAVVLPALLVPALIALAACGAADANQSSPTGSGASAGSESQAATSGGDTASTTAGGTTAADTTAPAGPELPPDTEVAAPVARALMPEATGKFGEKPTITMPKTPAPDSLQRVVLSEGDGAVSKAGDTVVVNYLGQVWGGDVFDNSYDRGSPYTVQVGGAQRTVVVGWDVGLQGVKAGSRVLLSFPPQDGYGSAGNPPKIGGTDTLVFVVDIVDVYAVDAAGQADAAPQVVPDGWPAVGGELGTVPTLAAPTTIPEPAEPGVTLVAKGTGAPVQAGEVLVQYVAVAWDGSKTEQSWPDPTGKNPASGSGPQAFPVSKDSAFAGLIGMPIGSRVLMRTPVNKQAGMPALAWVIDIIAQKNVTSAG